MAVWGPLTRSVPRWARYSYHLLRNEPCDEIVDLEMNPIPVNGIHHEIIPENILEMDEAALYTEEAPLEIAELPFDIDVDVSDSDPEMPELYIRHVLEEELI